MGNCQAVDAAALVIQHPGGRIERMYWAVSASEVMKMNPGHYVSLIIPLSINGEENSDDKTVRFTRVKLLRPTDTLVLGRAYRLVTTQEVMKVLRAKKHAKMKQQQPEEAVEVEMYRKEQSSSCQAKTQISHELERTSKVMRYERHRHRLGSVNSAAAGSKSWCPSLQSISETGN